MPTPISEATSMAKQPSPRRNKLTMAPYFFTVVCLFAVVTMYLNRSFAHDPNVTAVENALKESVVSRKGVPVLSDQAAPNKPAIQTDVGKLAGLNCEAYGGPADAAEMVYWRDIPQDNVHVSPFHRQQRPGGSASEQTQYVTFVPDNGGWNNIRMAMESVLAMAFAMGRTLVLPPEKEFYLLKKKTTHDDGQQQRSHFGFNHFFHMEAIHNEHPGLDIITMQEYLEREAGNFREADGNVLEPPGGRTQWDGASTDEINKLFRWLAQVSYVANWNPDHCLATFPSSPQRNDVQELQRIESIVQKEQPNWEDYVGKPVDVNASTLDRLRENWAQREKLCIYDETMQQAAHLHFPSERGARLLVHFYAFVFFQDWQTDLWMKRFVRDHVRYVDEIQCAAARVVTAVRKRCSVFDSFHIRRGDFQYKKTRVSAEEILEMAKKKIPPESCIYIGTDERDQSFFQPLKDYYHEVLFLDDFLGELKGINSNYFGMIDQLVTSRGRSFFGCWFSTFTGYIMRLRGYHASLEKPSGYEDGITNSWFYTLADRFDFMQRYYPVKKVFYAREFPTSWRNIDFSSGAPVVG